ncbi:hypothetical protein OE88DRAFT_1641123 [Heliocybe sulcata]|uniref:Uncharacterized protein n=1 Tax=Heliocybe sulcata TaxID=5364 RepID=A0A5C3NHT4_9AGAM|nr:hypothetical protein OE88DRAFT_1641123 [Heliocybe sulcata]
MRVVSQQGKDCVCWDVGARCCRGESGGTMTSMPAGTSYKEEGSYSQLDDLVDYQTVQSLYEMLWTDWWFNLTRIRYGGRGGYPAHQHLIAFNQDQTGDGLVTALHVVAHVDRTSSSARVYAPGTYASNHRVPVSGGHCRSNISAAW